MGISCFDRSLNDFQLLTVMSKMFYCEFAESCSLLTLPRQSKAKCTLHGLKDFICRNVYEVVHGMAVDEWWAAQ